MELRTREEVLLALIAGEKVDEKTRQMTPPLGASVSEDLLLKIADRLGNLDNGGGSGDDGLYLLTPTEEGIEQSYNDVKAAFDAGKRIELHWAAQNGNEVAICTLAMLEESQTLYRVNMVDLRSGDSLIFVSEDPDKPLDRHTDSGGGGMS